MQKRRKDLNGSFVKLQQYEEAYQARKNLYYRKQDGEELAMIQTQLRKIFFSGNVSDISAEIGKRKTQADKIAAGINLLGEEAYGIKDLNQLISDCVPSTEEVQILSARAMKIPTIEQLSGAIMARDLNQIGVPSIYDTFSFHMDMYGNNEQKNAWAKTLIGYQKQQVHKQAITLCDGKLDKQTFYSLKFSEESKLWNGLANAEKNLSLVDFHNNLWEQSMQTFCPKSLDKNKRDAGKFFQKCLEESFLNCPEKLPENTYFMQNGVAQKISKKEILNLKTKDGVEFQISDLRPPAWWYYPLDLVMYASGERMLLAYRDTPDDRFGGYFAHSSKIIEDATGFSPLILELPAEVLYPFKVCKQEIPLTCLSDPDWHKKINFPKFSQKVDEVFHSYMVQMLML